MEYPEKPIKIVRLPMPASCLSQNVRAHWSVKSKAAAKNRLLCKLIFEQAFYYELKEPDFQPFAVAAIKEVFYFKDKRKRDVKNYAAMTKSTVDALIVEKVTRKQKLIGAGILIDDDKVTWITPEIIIGTKEPHYLEYHFYHLGM